jgi:hypothetical protein
LAAPALSNTVKMPPRDGRAPRRDGAAAPDQPNLVRQPDEVDPLPFLPSHEGNDMPY